MTSDQYDIRAREAIETPGRNDTYGIGRGDDPKNGGGAESHLVRHPRMATGRRSEHESGGREVRAWYLVEREDSDD
ncbi:hypothetical protein OG239_41905 (plasmid) [Streptomyces sp. NBC_00868]|uniref:hypothetical protein n=1 Tax=Streptomyces sp. NBC_00868 TaxID=2903683 RepID=UPI0038702A9F|nr:hypothetical protein OG239_41905 [Streptomyces sp. NBC_00868]